MYYLNTLSFCFLSSSLHFANAKMHGLTYTEKSTSHTPFFYFLKRKAPSLIIGFPLFFLMGFSLSLFFYSTREKKENKTRCATRQLRERERELLFFWMNRSFISYWEAGQNPAPLRVRFQVLKKRHNKNNTCTVAESRHLLLLLSWLLFRTSGAFNSKWPTHQTI